MNKIHELQVQGLVLHTDWRALDWRYENILLEDGLDAPGLQNNGFLASENFLCD